MTKNSGSGNKVMKELAMKGKRRHSLLPCKSKTKFSICKDDLLACPSESEILIVSQSRFRDSAVYGEKPVSHIINALTGNPVVGKVWGEGDVTESRPWMRRKNLVEYDCVLGKSL